MCEKADFTHGMIKLIPVDSVLSTKSGVFVEKMRSFRVLSTESGVFVDKTCCGRVTLAKMMVPCVN